MNEELKEELKEEVSDLFWVTWNVSNQKANRTRIYSEDEAVSEAKRMCLATGKAHMIMQVVGTVKPVPVEVLTEFVRAEQAVTK